MSRQGAPMTNVTYIVVLFFFFLTFVLDYKIKGSLRFIIYKCVEICTLLSEKRETPGKGYLLL